MKTNRQTKQIITFAIIATCGVNFSLCAADAEKNRLVREYVQSVMEENDKSIKQRIMEQANSDNPKRDFETFRKIWNHIKERLTDPAIDSISATGRIIEDVARQLGLRKVRIFVRNPDEPDQLVPLTIQIAPY